MNIHPPNHPLYSKSKSCLRTTRDKEKAVNKLLSEEKIPVNEAYYLINWIYDNNIAMGRRNGGYYMLGSGVVAALFIAIFAFTGRLYYIILPIALFSFFKGLHEFLTTNGYDG